MNRKRAAGILLVLCVAGAGISGAGLLRELSLRKEAEQVYEDIRKTFIKGAVKDLSEETDRTDSNRMDGNRMDRIFDWEGLKNLNPDICGWIYGPGTPIDYPIVQGNDDTWYLDHAADRTESVAGAVFLESGNQKDFRDEVSVLYGHHIRGGRMFSSLSGYKKQSYYEQFPRLYLYTQESVCQVELFAGTVIDGRAEIPLAFADMEERKLWLEKLRDASTFKSGRIPEQGERILALCTCSYEYQNARYIVYGVLESLEIEEPTRERESTVWDEDRE